MELKTSDNSSKSIVAEMRTVRDQINLEIEEMTFAEERIYIDRILNEAEQLIKNNLVDGSGD